MALRSADPAVLAMFQQLSLVSTLAKCDRDTGRGFVVVPLTLAGVVLPFDLVLYAAHA